MTDTNKIENETKTKICTKCASETELLDMADNDSGECFNCAKKRILDNSEFYQLNIN